MFDRIRDTNSAHGGFTVPSASTRDASRRSETASGSASKVTRAIPVRKGNNGWHNMLFESADDDRRRREAEEDEQLRVLEEEERARGAKSAREARAEAARKAMQERREARSAATARTFAVSVLTDGAPKTPKMPLPWRKRAEERVDDVASSGVEAPPETPQDLQGALLAESTTTPQASESDLASETLTGVESTTLHTGGAEGCHAQSDQADVVEDDEQIQLTLELERQAQLLEQFKQKSGSNLGWLNF